MQRLHTLCFVLTWSAACGSPTEKPLIATPTTASPTPSAAQAAPLIIDAGTLNPDAPALPPLACADGTTAIAALYPELAWYCTRADGVRHGAFYTLFPDYQIESEGSYKDGKLDGAWQRRYPGGAIAETGAYVAGLRDGAWKQNDASGTTLGEYKLKQGTGKQKRWLADGPLYSEVTLKAGVPHGPARIYDRNGTLLVIANLYAGKLDGKHIVGGKNTLRIEETFVRGTRRGARQIWQFWALLIDEAYDAKGRLDGDFAMWRDKRTPRVHGTYEHGKRTGTWVWTDKNNKKEREGDYVDGKKRGLWSEWVDDKLYFQGTFDAGKPDGDFVYYDKTGAELGRFSISGGTGTMLTYHPNKNVATKTQMVNGLMDGKYEELSLRGKTIVEGRYAKDLKHGVWREQTELGVVTLEQTWKRGKLDGAWKKLADGKLTVQATYKDGLADGTYTEFHINGKPSLVGQFTADKRTGTWTSYEPDGAVTLTATYKDGVLEGPWRQLASGVVLDGEMRGGHRTGTWTQTDRAGQKSSVTYPTPSDGAPGGRIQPP